MLLSLHRSEPANTIASVGSLEDPEGKKGGGTRTTPMSNRAILKEIRAVLDAERPGSL